MHFIDLQSQYQSIAEAVQRGMTDVLRRGHYVNGPENQRFEQQLAKRMRIKHCVGVGNGTDALMIAMMALGIGRGDVVIMPSFTFIAAAEVTMLLGAKPVFVDIDPETYLIDPNAVEAAVNANTKLIVGVDLFGQSADYDALAAMATRYHIPIIQDAAQSIGSTYHDRPVGDRATIMCTSFYPSKPLACYGDGGACLTQDDTLAERIRHIANHGETTRYDHQVLGVNSRLDTLQAAVLLAKLAIFDEELAKRRAVAQYYDDQLKRIGIEPPAIAPHNRSVYAQYTIRVKKRDALRAMLSKRGIPTAVHYPKAVHQQRVCQSFKRSDDALIHSEGATRHVLSLPFHPYLTREEQGRVVDGLKAFIR